MIRLLIALLIGLPVFGQATLSWKVKHPKTGKYIVFGEKGSVQEMLVSTGELPDPFVQDNEKLFGWIERYNWEFLSEFSITGAELSHDFVTLEMPNVDTYAKVFVNGVYAGFTENTYVVYRFPVKKLLKPGKNTVKLIFESPVAYQKQHMAEVGTVLPSPNDKGEVSAAPYCRKPQYQFGWDWALRMTTIGMWKPAKIIVSDVNRLIGKTIRFDSVNETLATGSITLFLEQPYSGPLAIKSDQFGEIRAVSENGVARFPVSVEKPKLWWPRGHGEQFLYGDEVTVSVRGKIIAAESFRFGVKKSELIQQDDQWGRSYVIRVNGRDIFCKGANYIPQDIFPARVKDEDIRKMVGIMAESNFNMVRVWGGGYYPDEVFYNACDELGIMVWQDFMFACAMYPGNEPFLKLVGMEFDQQIPRISAHPSVVLFNGNNEVDVAWKNWGFVEEYKLKQKSIDLINKYYQVLFKEFLPGKVEKWSAVPYIHTSPLSNWDKAENFGYGTQHYWGVWHGNDPIEDFGRKVGRFNAEYGFQSFPEFSTLLTFSTPDQWSLDSKVMEHHQKSYVGNGMIAKHSDRLYGKTSDFRRFVYYSQLTESKAVSIAIAGHRTGMPRCSGTIFWQLNDCWPAPTWSSIDNQFNWKALQYEARKDYEDVAVVDRIDTLGTDNFCLVSDVYRAFAPHVTATVYNLKGDSITTMSCQPAVFAPTVIPLFANELQHFRNSDYIIDFEWKNETGAAKKRRFAHLPNRTTVEESRVSLELQQVDSSSETAVIVVTNEEFLADFWIYSMKLGVKFDSNFEHLLPGRHEFRIRFEEAPKRDDFGYFFH